MPVLIKSFCDGCWLEYDHGKFDAWCIYLANPNGRYAPRDVDYFSRLYALGETYGHARIYADFVKIYAVTTAELKHPILQGIERLASAYGADTLEIEKLLTILYAGMVAEENKDKAVLKKRIKRLGMHQVLVDKLAPEVAAHFSRGKPWRTLDQECLARGF